MKKIENTADLQDALLNHLGCGKSAKGIIKGSGEEGTIEQRYCRIYQDGSLITVILENEYGESIGGEYTLTCHQGSIEGKILLKTPPFNLLMSGDEKAVINFLDSHTMKLSKADAIEMLEKVAMEFQPSIECLASKAKTENLDDNAAPPVVQDIIDPIRKKPLLQRLLSLFN